MPSRFDHLVIAVRDLDAAIARYQHLGFEVTPGGKHTGRGTYNALIRFGLDYIELIRRGGTRAQASWGVLLEMAALKLPHTAQDVMPFAILFGTMLAFWRLTRSNELVVARAAGVSVWGFLTPAILVALLVGS